MLSFKSGGPEVKSWGAHVKLVTLAGGHVWPCVSFRLREGARDGELLACCQTVVVPSRVVSFPCVLLSFVFPCVRNRGVW